MSVVGRLFFADGGKSDWEALSTIVKMVWEWRKKWASNRFGDSGVRIRVRLRRTAFRKSENFALVVSSPFSFLACASGSINQFLPT